MRSTRILAAALLLLVAAPALPAPNDGVATIGKQSITQEELDRAVGSRLMRLRTEEYTIKKTALDDLIAERLLAAEAAKRVITVEELLKTEVGGRITVPTKEEVEPFYEGTKERFSGSKEEAIQQIIEGMRRQRIATRTAEYVKTLRDAAGVKILLEPPRAKIDLAGPTKGNAHAAVTIVEFSDFECPFCSRAHQTMQKIADKYGDDVKFVFLDYPLAIHRTAPRAAAAARCAADQDKFWEMHDRFFSKNGGPVQDADIRKYATESGIEMTKFNACLDSGKYADSWKDGQAAGSKLGVQSTPTFFVNGRMVVGAAPLESFASVIDDELARSKPASPPAVAAK